jgi:nitrile hydratase subunit beta
MSNSVFNIGQRVRVREAYPPGHVRTPFYIRGKIGHVTRVLGEFKNPERLGLGLDGLPKKMLYEVRFQQVEIWPNYNGPVHDTVDIDLYQHWLEKA